ncbi:cyclin-dependent kinase-like Serine/Threonine kinase family protein (macronuclear) [Tetrahymena thermophila SB210]|uniref:Cyclin-dependent kinase 2 homolog n=1 Tax=Tetrahymena thermophila (strain SB210) TaxID=312017 RepID=I7MDF3_TETTS|nr:cyclin-dependent kinase-like Serine/Threonine kinase family protein [Tetrahymena thermophila SB210]EAR87479.1 cyclin-dependent kinase-like Serine/Threonine kinase family protein [Tetrahymena thermophila SB210]|eukprot:XP_001007724.1 cyclin-dependent kinase-like Serine/Threonine kinase family protein [Tetrahymena thermophila SB210]
MSDQQIDKQREEAHFNENESSDSNFDHIEDNEQDEQKNEINLNLDDEERKILRKHSQELSAEKKLSLLRKRKICGLLEGCDSVDNYQKLNKIHEGVYGVVYRAVDKLTGEIIAIKKTKIDRKKEKEGFPITSIREFNILMALRHENIVAVKRVVMGTDLDSIYMIMEYMEHELKDVIENHHDEFQEPQIKSLVQQLLLGMDFLQKKKIMHRDLKTSNILYNNKGQLKICDFGLGRRWQGNKPYTLNVVTMWYRAPEVLLGQDKYTTALDMWSVGCIFGELITKDQLFKGKNETNQIECIFNAMGGPTERSWPGWTEFKHSKLFKDRNYPSECTLNEKIGNRISQTGYKLLCQMLTLNPKERITATKALQDPWFKEEPLPAKLEDMPKFKPLNEISREERKKLKLNNQQAQQQAQQSPIKE